MDILNAESEFVLTFDIIKISYLSLKFSVFNEQIPILQVILVSEKKTHTDRNEQIQGFKKFFTHIYSVRLIKIN